MKNKVKDCCYPGEAERSFSPEKEERHRANDWRSKIKDLRRISFLFFIFLFLLKFSIFPSFSAFTGVFRRYQEGTSRKYNTKVTVRSIVSKYRRHRTSMLQSFSFTILILSFVPWLLFSFIQIKGKPSYNKSLIFYVPYNNWKYTIPVQYFTSSDLFYERWRYRNTDNNCFSIFHSIPLPFPAQLIIWFLNYY